MPNTTSPLNPFHIIGGLLSDVVEVTKFVGTEIMDIPDALSDGWKNGALLDTDSSVVPHKVEPEVIPTNKDIDAEIVRLTAMKTATSMLTKA